MDHVTTPFISTVSSNWQQYATTRLPGPNACSAQFSRHQSTSPLSQPTAIGRAGDGSVDVRIGNDPQPQMGPLVSSTQFERVTSYIRSGREEGAHVVTGGGQVGYRGYFVESTVLLDVNEGMRLVREETFGPVLVAQPVDDLDEIVRAANDTLYGLTASVWTRDLNKAHKVADRR